jgi:hypothetical protein
MTQEDICAFFAEQDRALTAIENNLAANHMKLWASTPAWQMAAEERRHLRQLLDAAQSDSVSTDQ